ncbi:PepSY-associated TM helix domain-containing protein [Sphingomonas sp. DBB INV C78]|uniref:PepSY-associated TM helix domain-containing protein n=1 Tax=Sphingomonas sp. DBB INV C78 TaxID=3349434 RepID=UPI0036D2B8BF
MREDLYRTVWRWHFYAGLIVLPFLAWLAVTGGLYLYKPEIEGALYRSWSAASGPAMAIAPMIGQVEDETGARVASVMRPAEVDASWRMTLEGDNGRRLAFVDPANGHVLGTTRDGGTMALVKNLHSLAITGPIGNALIEIAAGWTILLVATGFYLWWPRGGNPAVAVRGRPAGRLFWRDLHASTGAIVGAVILFLAVTGMPWSGVWGEGLRAVVAHYGIGRPKAPNPDHGDHRAALPWALQEVASPHAGHHAAIGPDRVIAIAGMAAPWQLVPPKAMGQPWLVASVVTRAEDARAVYVDPASGAVLADMRFGQFGAGAKAVEWGIAVHQGQEYGEANRFVMLLGCVAALLLCVTAPVLWWKRRFATPPRPSDPARARGVAAIMLVAGLIFPLTGATMLAALLGEKIMTVAFRRRTG